MTPWEWWWLADGDDGHGDWRGEHGSREEAIADAERELHPGTRFEVMEARSSEAMEHEGSDCVPFLRTRNRETLTTRAALTPPQATDSGVDLDPPMKRRYYTSRTQPSQGMTAAP